jgi:hypothetical protein
LPSAASGGSIFFRHLPRAQAQLGATAIRQSRRLHKRATLGDGGDTLFDVHDANIIWDGQIREIEINSANTNPSLLTVNTQYRE